MCNYIFLIIFLPIFCMCESSEVCKQMLDRNLTIYVKWPYKLSCSKLFNNYSKPSKCIISDGNHAYNESFVIDLKKLPEKLIKYNLTMTSGFICKKLTVVIQPRLIYNLTPSQDGRLHKDMVSNKYFDLSSQFSDHKTIHCIDKSSSTYFPEGNWKFDWFYTKMYKNLTLYNTSELLGYPWYESLDLDGTSLMFSINFYHPGLYTCAVKLNGVVLYTSHTQVCVRESSDRIKPTIICNKNITFSAGSNINIACTAQIDSSLINENQINVTWFKKNLNDDSNETLCKNHQSTVLFAKDEDVRCRMKRSKSIPKVCFYHVPSVAELEEQSPFLTPEIILSLKNLHKSDAGVIYVQLHHYGKSSTVQTILLEYNHSYELAILAIALSVCLSFILLGVTLVLVYWQFHIQIKLFIRRHMGKYDDDNKEYVAMISYVVPTHQKSFQTTAKVVKWIKCLLDKKQYSYYDEHQHMELGPWVETFIRNLERSHRMIVLLTTEYVKEAKARFETSQALENMLKNKTKIIFICCDGAKQALYSSKNIKFKNDLQKAVKAVRNIKFKEGMTQQKFFEMLDYALPNLDRKTTNSKVIYNASLEDVGFERSSETPVSI